MFPKNSAWGQQEDAERRAAVEREAALPSPVRHVGQPNIVEVPLSVLEQWINSLDLAENGGDVQDVIQEMRSYFRG